MADRLLRRPPRARRSPAAPRSSRRRRSRSVARPRSPRRGRERAASRRIRRAISTLQERADVEIPRAGRRDDRDDLVAGAVDRRVEARAVSAGWVAAATRGRALARAWWASTAREPWPRAVWARRTHALVRPVLRRRPSGRSRSPAGVGRHAVEATIWQLRVLAGWLPPGQGVLARLFAAPMEIANIEAAARPVDRRATPEPPFRLGSLAVAWPRVAAAGVARPGPRRACHVGVGRSRGRRSSRASRSACGSAWARRLAHRVPEAAPWAKGAVAVLVARERFAFDRWHQRAHPTRDRRPPGSPLARGIEPSSTSRRPTPGVGLVAVARRAPTPPNCGGPRSPSPTGSPSTPSACRIGALRQGSRGRDDGAPARRSLAGARRHRGGRPSPDPGGVLRCRGVTSSCRSPWPGWRSSRPTAALRRVMVETADAGCLRARPAPRRDERRRPRPGRPRTRRPRRGAPPRRARTRPRRLAAEVEPICSPGEADLGRQARGAHTPTGARWSPAGSPATISTPCGLAWRRTAARSPSSTPPRGVMPPTAHGASRRTEALRPLVSTYATVPYRDIDPTWFAALRLHGDVRHDVRRRRPRRWPWSPSGVAAATVRPTARSAASHPPPRS